MIRLVEWKYSHLFLSGKCPIEFYIFRYIINSIIFFLKFSTIRYPMQKTEPGALAVCVGPIFENYSNALRLVEFIEMYRILGAQHFYIYNKLSTNDVSLVVEYYKNRGVVTVLNWNLSGMNFSKTCFEKAYSKAPLKALSYNGIFAKISFYFDATNFRL